MTLSHPEKFNIPLAKKVLRRLQLTPWQHNQQSWGYDTACGTRACVAGWTCILDEGTEVKLSETGRMYVGSTKDYLEYCNSGISTKAAELLGLEDPDEHGMDSDVWKLFIGSKRANARGVLKSYIAEAEAYWAEQEAEAKIKAEVEEQRQAAIDAEARQMAVEAQQMAKRQAATKKETVK